MLFRSNRKSHGTGQEDQTDTREETVRNIIIAGTYQEAKDWRERNDKSVNEWVYLSNPKTIVGLSEVHGVFIGTWKERPDIEEILDIMASMRKPGKLYTGFATAIVQHEAYKRNLEKNLV